MNLYSATSGSGPHLALLHGWGLNGAVWDSVVAPLSAHFTVQCIDLPGHGFSATTPFRSLSAAADAIAAILPAGSHLLGWSLGGLIALAIAQRHGERIDKLALVATTPRFVSAADWPHGKKAAVLDDFAKRLATGYAATIRSFLALQTLNQANARATIAALQTAMSARGEPSAHALQDGLRVLRDSDLRAEVGGIGHCALVLQGDHDALTAPAAARWLAANLQNARYVQIEHAAHAPFLSHPPAFLQAIHSFLAP
jgi:pimeloyl-[acyl-carrier protein] methyl ester esterase